MEGVAAASTRAVDHDDDAHIGQNLVVVTAVNKLSSVLRRRV